MVMSSSVDRRTWRTIFVLVGVFGELAVSISCTVLLPALL